MFKIFGKELEETKGRLEALSQAENEHLQELSKLKALLVESDSQLGAAQKEIKSLDQELSSLKKQSSSEIENNAKAIAKLEKELEKLNKEKATLAATVIQAQDELKTLNKKLPAQEKQAVADLAAKDKIILKSEKDLEKLTKEKESLLAELVVMKEARTKALADNTLNYDNFVNLPNVLKRFIIDNQRVMALQKKICIKH